MLAAKEENEDDISHGSVRCWSHDNMQFLGRATQQISAEVEEISFL